MREIRMLRSTRRGLETWHGRDGATLADEGGLDRHKAHVGRGTPFATGRRVLGVALGALDVGLDVRVFDVSAFETA